MNRKTIGIVLFDDVEVLDFCGPFEVFSVARVDESHRREDASPFEVLLVAENAGPVRTSGNMQVLPHVSFDDCPQLDIIVVPGGWGTRIEIDNQIMLSFVRCQAKRAALVTSVCTGSLVLGKAGLLDGLRATTHWQALDLMTELLPTVEVDRGRHVVEDGSVLTSAGISAGIDLALRVVARECGEGVARATARYMEYPYPDSDDRRIHL
ncbi:MAG: DJ-1/PfpI family protein [Gammaproteobacteria bacterium]|nr:MAG: DJ-1/PfpI family protein [Gammaproteobacteria bacterium]